MNKLSRPAAIRFHFAAVRIADLAEIVNGKFTKSYRPAAKKAIKVTMGDGAGVPAEMP